MRKLAGVSVMIALAVTIMTILVKSNATTSQAEVLTEQTKRISIHELHQQIDIKNLPVQETAAPI